jgi:hypothetical protein
MEELQLWTSSTEAAEIRHAELGCEMVQLCGGITAKLRLERRWVENF